MEPDRQADIAALDATLTTVERVLDVDGLRRRIEKLEHEASDPKLWDDQARAQRVTSELSHAQGELRRVEELRAAPGRPAGALRAGGRGGEGADDALAEADAELKALRDGHRSHRGAHPALGRVRRARGAASPSAPAPAGWTPPTGPRC